MQVAIKLFPYMIIPLGFVESAEYISVRAMHKGSVFSLVFSCVYGSKEGLT